MYNFAQPLAFFALEESTAIFSAALFDETGSAVVGSAFAWTLSDDNGNVINGRQNVPIAGSGSAVVVILTGLDTKRQTLQPNSQQVDDLVRCLKITGSYNSAKYGNGVPIVGIYYFGITPLPVQ